MKTSPGEGRDGWFPSALDFVESAIRFQGLKKIAAALGTVIAILVALGVVHDRASATPFIFIGVCGLSIILMTAMWIDRRRVYQILKDASGVLNHYAMSVNAMQGPTYFDLVEWDERVVVSSRGRADIVRKFKLRVGPQPMSTFWSSISIDPPPPDHKYKEKVTTRAIILDPTQPGTDVLVDGMLVPYSYVWEGHKLNVYVHLPEHMAPGSELDVALVFSWPGYFNQLLEGDPESTSAGIIPNEWVFHRTMGQFDYLLSLDSKFVGDRLPQVRSLQGSPAPRLSKEPSGNTLVNFSASNPTIGQTIGFNLQLRPAK